jgi:LCP family protein required for cell wall assembly
VRSPRAARTPPAGRVLVGLVAFLSLFVAAAAAYGFGFYTWANGKLVRIHHPALELPCENGCNYLVLGSDSRAGLSPGEASMFGTTGTVGGHRSDTIMLVHINSARKRAVVLSFPRDLWVDIPHMGWGKLTEAYAGGPNRVALTLERISGLSINGFAGVNLAGFEKVVTALGGVPICVDRPMVDSLSGLNLSAGCHNLDGFQALAFVRARHVQGDCIPDFSRIGRQQQFLRAVIAKILTPSELIHAPSLIQAVAHNLTVDNLDIADLIHLTTELRGVSTGNADFRAVPGSTGTISSTGQSVVFMSHDAKLLFKRLKTGKPLGTIGTVLDLTPYTPANIRIRVFDESSGGKAQKVNGLLTQAGFDIQDLKTAQGLQVGGAALLYKPDTKPMADVVHGFLPTLGEKEVTAKVLPEVDVAVVIPSSYDGPPITSPPPAGPSSGGTSAGC